MCVLGLTEESWRLVNYLSGVNKGSVGITEGNYIWSRCNPTEAVDTHRHSGNSHTFLFQNGALVMNPVWSSARKLAVRVSAHSGNRVPSVQTTTTGQTLAAKVTPSPYLSKSAGLPEAQTTSGART